MTPEAMGTLVKRYFAATRAMDLTAWLACFADDAVSHDPYGGTAMHGKGELTRFFQSVGGAFTEIGFTEDFVAVAGNRVAVKFTSAESARTGNLRSAKASTSSRSMIEARFKRCGAIGIRPR